MDIPQITKIIYLDQKAWIEISKFKENRTSLCNKELFDQITGVRDSGNVIFQISFTRLLEISIIKKMEQIKRAIVKDIGYFSILYV